MSPINSSPTGGLSRAAKIAIAALASVVVFLFVLVILLAVSRGTTAPAPITPAPPTPIGTSTPATLRANQPQVIASPNQISAGESLAVFGSNWTPGDTVTVFLRDPAKPAEPIVQVGRGQATAQGTLAVTFDFPGDARWAQLLKVDVIVQAASTGAYAFTTIEVVPSTMTPTPTATVIPASPTATSTKVPASATPTRRPPSATPTARVITDWRGEYFANTTLTGAPIVVRNDAAVNFNWGRNAPAAGLPVDNFSARWTRQLWFAAQTYRFTLRADDGVRLWIDNTSIIDEWHSAADTAYTRDVNLAAGWHALRIEFYEGSGDALIQFKIEQAPVTFADWKGEYWANSALKGQPVLTRNDAAINFDWGQGAPADSLPVDNFSARWTRQLWFAAQTYRFTLRADDGVRFYIDGLLLIDEWRDADGRTYTRDVQLSAGNHTLRLDYYEHQGGASVAFTMQRAEDYTKWKGEYFANDQWRGLPAVVRNDDRLDFDWGSGSPDGLIPPDRFSVRWSRSIDLDAGVYRFDLTVDDGVRFYVDGNLVLDKVLEADAQYSVQLNLSKGRHDFRIDYVEFTGRARFIWTRTFVATFTPTPTATPPTPTKTKTPTATPPTPTLTKTPTATSQAGLALRGRVRLNSASGPGVGGVNIYRSFASYPGVVVATTDATGFYQADFQNIPGDEMVTVWAQLAGYVFDPAQYNWRHYYGYEDRTLDFVVYLPTATPTATPIPTATPTATSTATPTPTETATPIVDAERGEYYSKPLSHSA